MRHIGPPASSRKWPGLPKAPPLGQRRRPPPAAETGRSCWGRGQRDASGSEADAGSRNPGSVTEGDGEGKPGTKEPLRSDGQVSLRTTSPSSLRDATSPSRGGFGSPRKVNGFARGSPTRGAVERSETERLYEGQPDHGRKAQFFALPTCKKAVIRVE